MLKTVVNTFRVTYEAPSMKESNVKPHEMSEKGKATLGRQKPLFKASNRLRNAISFHKTPRKKKEDYLAMDEFELNYWKISPQQQAI